MRMQCELNDVESPEGPGEQSTVSTPGTSSSPQSSLPQSQPSTSSNNSSDGLRDNVPCLKYVTYVFACRRMLTLCLSVFV